MLVCVHAHKNTFKEKKMNLNNICTNTKHNSVFTFLKMHLVLCIALHKGKGNFKMNAELQVHAETDVYIHGVCIRLLLGNDLSARGGKAEKLRRCFMKQGHYDKGQSVISIVLSPSPVSFPYIKGTHKQSCAKQLKQTYSSRVTSVMCAH